MRKVVIYGFVLVCAAAVSPFILTAVGTTADNFDKLVPVEVTNFPPVQTVSGGVSVGNLPLDGNGHVLVAIQNLGSNALVLHSTTATYQGNLGGRTGATQKCRSEFPGSHFANESGVYNAFGTRGVVWTSSETSHSWMDGGISNGGTCYGWTRLTDPNQGTILTGRALFSTGLLFLDQNCDQSLPLLCAE